MYLLVIIAKKIYDIILHTNGVHTPSANSKRHAEHCRNLRFLRKDTWKWLRASSLRLLCVCPSIFSRLLHRKSSTCDSREATKASREAMKTDITSHEVPLPSDLPSIIDTSVSFGPQFISPGDKKTQNAILMSAAQKKYIQIMLRAIVTNLSPVEREPHCPTPELRTTKTLETTHSAVSV
jgi:hypothetical protein